MAARGSRQQKIGKVGAGDQQHTSRRAEEYPKRNSQIAGQVFAQRDNHRTRLFVGVRIFRFQTLRNRRHLRLRLRLRHGHSGFQTSDAYQEVRSPASQQTRIQFRRSPEFIPPIRKYKAGRHHADYFIRLVGHDDLASQDVPVAAKTALPNSVAEDDHLGVRPFVVVVEHAADLRLRSQNVPEVRRDSVTLYRFGRSIAGQVVNNPAHRGDAREYRVLLAPIQPVGRGRSILRKSLEARILPNHHDAIRLIVRQLAKQHGIDDREDGGVCPNSQRQSENRGGRKSGIAAKETPGEPEVLHDSITAQPSSGS